MAVWTIRWNNRTTACGRAPSEASLESHAVSAIVMSITALWNLNASFLNIAPTVARGSTLAFATVVIAGGTIDGNSDT